MRPRGQVACWARGRPQPTRDVDLIIRPEDAEAALEALGEAAHRTERPPEQWLYKAWCDGVLVDLIFEPLGLAVDDAMFRRCEPLNVAGMRADAMPMEDVITTKLLALNEHALDLEPPLEIARALRERINWDDVWRRTEASPFARAFPVLSDELGVSGPSRATPRAATRVRIA